MSENKTAAEPMMITLPAKHPMHAKFKPGMRVRMHGTMSAPPDGDGDEEGGETGPGFAVESMEKAPAPEAPPPVTKTRSRNKAVEYLKGKNTGKVAAAY